MWCLFSHCFEILSNNNFYKKSYKNINITEENNVPTEQSDQFFKKYSSKQHTQAKRWFCYVYCERFWSPLINQKFNSL